MALSFVQNYPDTRLISLQRNKDNGKLLSQQLEIKRRITEEEEQLAQKRNLDPLQKHQHLPWERYKLLVSPDKNKVDDSNEVRKFMIDAYGQGIKISVEENKKIVNYYQSLSPTEKGHLSKQIKCKQQYYAMEVAKNSSPISLPRKSLLDLHKKSEFDINVSTGNNALKSFPVGNEKYFISDEDSYMKDQENRRKYRDELYQTSIVSPIATTKTLINRHSGIGKSKGFIDFDHVRDANLIKNVSHMTRHDSEPHSNEHYAELHNALSLPQAYRKKIDKMECYK